MQQRTMSEKEEKRRREADRKPEGEAVANGSEEEKSNSPHLKARTPELADALDCERPTVELCDAARSCRQRRTGWGDTDGRDATRRLPVFAAMDRRRLRWL
jgi:hypothetical protein